MFEEYPKKRTVLPESIQQIYVKHYKLNREGQTRATSLAQKMEKWMHRQVARDIVGAGGPEKSTLELGAGTLNQLPYEPDVGPYDVVEPFADLFTDSPLLGRVRNIYDDITEVPAENRYDRITSIATLEHICDLPTVVAHCCTRLAEGGTFRASIPSEGTLLWTLGWRLTTGLEYRFKYGIDYGILMKYEHVNTAEDIEVVLKYFFDDVDHRVLGIARPLSFYRFYQCSSPRLDRCEAYGII